MLAAAWVLWWHRRCGSPWAAVATVLRKRGDDQLAALLDGDT
jgi:hypothetical protein